MLHGSISFDFYVVFLFLQSVPRQLPFIMFHSNSYAMKKAILQSSSLLHFVLISKKPHWSGSLFWGLASYLELTAMCFIIFVWKMYSGLYAVQCSSVPELYTSSFYWMFFHYLHDLKIQFLQLLKMHLSWDCVICSVLFWWQLFILLFTML